MNRLVSLALIVTCLGLHSPAGPLVKKLSETDFRYPGARWRVVRTKAFELNGTGTHGLPTSSPVAGGFSRFGNSKGLAGCRRIAGSRSTKPMSEPFVVGSSRRVPP